MRGHVENAQSLRLNHPPASPREVAGPPKASATFRQPETCSADQLGESPASWQLLLPPEGRPCPHFTRAIYHLRCEACYFVKRGNISYVYCKTNPRHKQRQGSKHKQGTVERPTAGFTHWTTRGVTWT